MSDVPIQHPSWCDRADCTVTDTRTSGSHTSSPMMLDPDTRTHVSAAVRLNQGTALRGYPHSDATVVDLTVRIPALDATDTDEELTVILRGEGAIALGRMLTSAGREAIR